MKENALLVAARLPHHKEDARDRRLSSLIRRLAGRYRLHVLFLQGVFSGREALEAVRETGAAVVSLDAVLSRGSDSRPDPGLGGYLASGRFSLILFDSFISARYVLPSVREHSPESAIVIDTQKSRYLTHLSRLSECDGEAEAAACRREAELTLWKEASLYSYADLILVEDAAAAQHLSGLLPHAEVRTLPGTGGTSGRRAADVMPSRRNGSLRPDPRTELEIIVAGPGDGGVTVAGAAGGYRIVRPRAGGNPAARLNEGLRTLTAPFGLVVPEGTVIAERTIEALLCCARSHPAAGIAVPVPAKAPVSAAYAAERARERVIAHFGHWIEIRRIPRRCFLLRRELVESAGLLDPRFRTLRYALADYPLKAFQAGYRTLLTLECAVFDGPGAEERQEDLERDRGILYDKWGIRGMDYLERNG